MAASSKYQCPFCHRPFWRLEGAGTTGLRYHLATTGNCSRRPAVFPEEELQKLIDHYQEVAFDRAPNLNPPPAPASTAYTTSSIPVDSLVATRDQHAVGRLIAVDGATCTVKIFLGPDQFSEVRYEVSRLARHKIPNKSRVYLQPGESDRWQAGHILGEVSADGLVTYRVGRPGRRPLDLSETEVEVLSTAVDLNPTDALASGAIESQKVYENRKAATDAIFNYRANGGGMTGPLSSSIELLPHQVEVIRRIMADPIQRYLLADEVGLGKTIEVGAMVRQILIDNPDEEIAVVVPTQLIPQWLREFDSKFNLSSYDGQIRVLSVDRLDELEDATFTTLIVDEVHDLIESAIDGYDLVSESPKVQSLIQMSENADRLFLMSATPVVSNDPATLTMLHMLDPFSYRLDQPEQFAQKVELRQEIGRLLLRLRPGSNSGLLLRAIEQLGGLIPNDDFIRQTEAIIRNTRDTALTDTHVRNLRRHVADGYRLHQRVLRSRRKDLPDWVLLPQSAIVSHVDFGNDSIDRIINQLLGWAERLATRSDADVPADDNSSGEVASLNEVILFRALFDSIASGHAAIEATLNQYSGNDGEIESIRSEIKRSSKSDDSVEHAAELVSKYLAGFESSGSKRPKLVAFTSSAIFAERFAEVLRSSIGPEAVPSIVDGMTLEDIDENINNFRESVEPTVLVCDKTGEEGLNLQFADGIVHLDLPFSASRLQQRIGRLDRFGRTHTTIHHLILLPATLEGSPWLAWFELLRDGFELFSQPISDVQFVLRELETDLERVLFHEGVAGLNRMAETVRSRIAEERTRLDEQYALDDMVLDAGEDSANSVSVADAIVDADDDGHAEDIVRWATKELGLVRESVPGMDPEKVFSLHLDGRAKIPQALGFSYLSDGLDTKITCYRQSAISAPGVQLMRPGSPIVDGLANLMRVDDRGVAFATWRTFPSMNQFGLEDLPLLRISFTVEYDPTALRESLAGEVDSNLGASVARRVDSLFPPISGTVHVGLDLDPESIPPEVRQIMSGQFDPEANNGKWRDYDLNGREEILDAVVDPAVLSRVGQTITSKIDRIVSGSPDFRILVDESRENAQQLLEIENGQLTRRKQGLNLLGEAVGPVIDKEIRINEAVSAAIVTPHVDLDSIGLIVISGRPPGTRKSAK